MPGVKGGRGGRGKVFKGVGVEGVKGGRGELGSGGNGQGWVKHESDRNTAKGMIGMAVPLHDTYF